MSLKFNPLISAGFDISSAPGGSGTVTSIASGTGLTGGPITTTGTLSLANTAVTPGSYTFSSLTVDQQGRITSASSGFTPANRALSNLQTTSVNQDLIPQGDQTQSLGTDASRWLTFYGLQLQFDASTNINLENRLMYDESSLLSIDYTGRVLHNATGTELLRYQTGELNDSSEILSIHWVTREAFAADGGVSINWDDRVTNDASDTVSIAWNARQLKNSDGSVSLNWASRYLNDGSGTPVVSWGGYTLMDSGGNVTVDWNSTVLRDNIGNINLDWFANTLYNYWQFSGTSVKLPTGTSDPAGTNAGDSYFNTNTSQLRIYNGASWVGVTLS